MPKQRVAAPVGVQSPRWFTTLGAVVRDTLDLRKHAFAAALERERVHAPQRFPVGLRNGAWHGVDSVIVEAERE